MKNILAAALAALAALALPSCSLLGFGSESDADTYTVSTPEELVDWMYAVQEDSAINCTLAKDIDMTGWSWTPVVPFSGTFDGGGHTISGLEISKGKHVTGFIGELSIIGTVKDLHIKDATVTGGNYYTAGIAAAAYGDILGCSFSGEVTGGADYTGAIAGYATGNVIACYSAGTVTADHEVGGIAGYLSGTLLGCYSTADVTGNSKSTMTSGGIVGWNYTGDMSYNFYSGEVSASLYGDPESSGSDDSYAQTDVDDLPNAWESAKSFMNNALKLGGYSYSYKTNAGSDSSAFPLILN